MVNYPPALEKLIHLFSLLPGIGDKTAKRLSFYILRSDESIAREFANSLIAVKEKIHFCEVCHNISEVTPCGLCSDPKRDKSIVCIVEKPSDVYLFEKIGFKGVYFVLGNVLSPLDGIGPDDLNISELYQRRSEIKEIIIATGAGVEGDATALYLAKILEGADIKVTQLARGLPVGSNIDYVDEATLSSSINNRVELP